MPKTAVCLQLGNKEDTDTEDAADDKIHLDLEYDCDMPSNSRSWHVICSSISRPCPASSQCR